MSWSNKKGFNFRATLGFVTDGANETWIGQAFGAYPQSKVVDGDTFNCGWETAPNVGNERDRNTTPDARLAGLVFVSNGQPEAIFRVDLPSTGDYEIEIAAGDSTNINLALFEVRDTTTALITRSEVTLALDEYVDASLTSRTPASTWVSSNTPVTKTFSTTIFRMAVPPPSGGTAAVLAHFSIRKLGPPPPGAVLYSQQSSAENELIALGAPLGPYSWIKPRSWF